VTATPGPEDQTLGAGDGVATSFQLRKAYGEVWRPINKPVEGSVRVAVAGVETGGFTLDVTTGVITLDAAPGAGLAVTAGFQFDTPVRFDSDFMEMTLESFEAGRMNAVAMVEIRV
jgi:uncharacterized protein (TIGR02217 family)